MKKIKSVILGLSILLLAGCGNSVPDEIRYKMMGSDDVPSDWVIFNEDSGEDWGGQMYNVHFGYGSEPEDPAVEHQLIIYTDSAEAIAGFEEYRDFIYVEGWSKPAEADFVPASPDDKLEYQCAELKINSEMTYNCFVLQQHENYVSAIGARLGKSITFDVLNSTLRSIDAKLNGGN